MLIKYEYSVRILANDIVALTILTKDATICVIKFIDMDMGLVK